MALFVIIISDETTFSTRDPNWVKNLISGLRLFNTNWFSSSCREQKNKKIKRQHDPAFWGPDLDFQKCWYRKFKKTKRTSGVLRYLKQFSSLFFVPRTGCLIVAVVEEAEPQLWSRAGLNSLGKKIKNHFDAPGFPPQKHLKILLTSP